MITITPLHNDIHSKSLKNTFIGKYIDILDANKIEYSLLPFYNQKEFWKNIQKSSHFIARYRGNEKDLSVMHVVLPEIERLGVKALPNFTTAYHCGDKSKLSAFYQANNISHPHSHIFWETLHLKQAIYDNAVTLPAIVKLRKGAASTNVIKVNNKSQLIKLSHQFFEKGVRPGMLEEAAYGKFYVFSLLRKWLFSLKPHKLKEFREKMHYIRRNDSREIESSCIIIQAFLANNDYDTRVTIIGNRAFAFRRFNRPDDFRASGSGLIDYDPKGIDMNMIEMAFEISKKYGFQTMAYDFIYDQDGKPSILEHNFTYVDKAVATCPIYWDDKLNSHNNNNTFPQYWQLVDFLEDDKLKL